MIIIGMTGTFGAGKDTVLKYLKDEYGFNHFSVSEFLKEEAARRGMPINRDSQHMIGNELRAKYGPGYIVEQLYDQAIASGGNSVIESFRAIGEVTTLRSKPQPFYLLAVDADTRIRYDRIVKRGSFKDNVSFEKFQADEEREMHDTDPAGMNIAECMKMADGHIENNGDLNALHEQIDKIIEPLLK